jgi:hypothetical protein
MKVFISSLISGMEPIRAAAREAVETLRHEAVMAEDFGAKPSSPQIACLQGLRQSDLVALVLGEKYGALQASGLSATHEEYREAKGKKPVIAFVQEGISPDAQQADFIREVQGWEGGLFRGAFKEANDLKVALTRALHDIELATAVGPVDQEDLTKRAKELLPTDRRGYYSGTATLNLAVTGGPRQAVLRPIELENPALSEAIHREALFGSHRLFDSALGVKREIEGDTLVVEQEGGKARILLNEQGSVLITVSVREGRGRMPELITEYVQQQCQGALGFAAWILDHIDATQRLSHVAVAVNLANAENMAWRTRQESEANPNSMSVGFGRGGNGEPVCANKTRSALRLDSARLVEDLIVPLRRQSR